MARRYGIAAALMVFCLVAGFGAASAQWVKDGVLVCGEANWQQSAQTCLDDSGRVVVVWMDYRNGNDWDIYGNKVDANGLVLAGLSGLPICTAPGFQGNPQVVPEGTGGGIVVWGDDRDGWRQIFAQRVDGDGNIHWAENGIAICDSMGTQDEPYLVPDGAGGAIVVWTESRSGHWDIYAQRIDADGNRLWATDGVPVCAVENDQYNPSVASDGAGGVVVAWFDYRNYDGDIFAQRIDANGDTLWAANGVPVCVATGYQQRVRIAAAPDGGAYFIWSDSRDGGNDLYAQHFDQDGFPVWTTDGVAVCPGYWNKYSPALAGDGSGGVIVAWYDERDDWTYPIYAQRIDATGNLAWGESGRVAIPGYSYESDIRMKADGAGGAILAADLYFDENSQSTDIYAQRLDNDGNRLWSANGIVVCGEAAAQYSPEITPDNSGGFFITWEDYRGTSGYSDLYCQRLGASGIWGDPEPEIVSCLDVPADQGGWVRIRTRASAQDPAGEIFGYNVWRMIEGGGGPMASLSEALPRLLDPAKAVGVRLTAKQAVAFGLPEGEWESVGFWFATRDTIYNIAVPTKNDSSEAGTPWETYIVTAHTPLPGIFIVSEPASGYSVDNLAPGMTPEFAGNESADPAGLVMTWSENPASDIWKYNVYRGDEEFFVPDASNLVGSTEELTLLDPTWHHSYMYFFKLVAVDRHGNGGPPALLRPEDINVGMLLQSFAASLRGSFVEVAWTIAEIDEAFTFGVLRKDGDGEFAELASGEIVREGLSFSFVDRGVEPGATYRYRVTVTDESGSRVLFETEAVSTPAMPLTLHQNHPNPFNPSTTIGYYLPEAAVVTLDVYSADGKLVTRLVNREQRPRGAHSVQWNGLDAQGSAVSSGVYFYRLQTGKETLSRKMVLMR